MNNIQTLFSKLQNLYTEKHQLDDIFQAFGYVQCHQLDWQINCIIDKIKNELLHKTRW